MKQVNRPWTDDDIGFAMNMYPRMSLLEIAITLGRTKNAVTALRSKVIRGIPVGDRRKWTDDDLHFMIDHLTKGPTYIARELGISKVRVESAAYSRGYVFGRKHLRDTHTVGRRLLLAKSCARCGLFLDAKWFKFSPKEGWSSFCKQCLYQSYGVGKVPNKAKQVAYRMALQNITVEKATRSGQPYVKSDFDVLADPTLTVFEKAIKCSRTYNGVASTALRYGYKSVRDYSDPSTGQWHISFPQSEAG